MERIDKDIHGEEMPVEIQEQLEEILNPPIRGFVFKSVRDIENEGEIFDSNSLG